MSKKAFPLWEQTKLTMMESLWSAQANINKYRETGNPRYWMRFKSQCVSCWIHIRPYRSKFTKKNPTNAKYVKQLDDQIVLLDDNLSQDEWIRLFKFLTDSYKKLGISDVGKMEDEDEWKTAMLEGFFDGD